MYMVEYVVNEFLSQRGASFVRHAEGSMWKSRVSEERGKEERKVFA